MGRGTKRSLVEGPAAFLIPADPVEKAASPSTALRAVPLPIACGDREDWADSANLDQRDFGQVPAQA